MNTPDDEDKPAAPGKAWATTGFLLGIAVSVAGNVAHTFHPSAAVLAAAGKTAAQWHPELGAQLGAAFFPLALLVTVEVLARVRWPHTWGWAATRYGGAALVAGVAAVVSYLHLYGLLLAYGEDDLTAMIGPLSVDGLMIVAGFALLVSGHAVAPAQAAPAAEPDLAAPSAPAHHAAPAAPTNQALPAPAVLRVVTRTEPVASAAGGSLGGGADGTAPAAAQPLVSASDVPPAVGAVPVVGNVTAAVRMLLQDGVDDPAAIKEKVPTLVGRAVPAATIDRTLRRLQSIAADTEDRQNTGAYL